MLTVTQPPWVCPHSRRVCFPCLHCLGSRLFCQELSEAGPGLYALPRSKPLKFRYLGTPQRCRLGWACVLCPSKVQAVQVTRCLVSTVAETYHLPIPAAQFSGCTPSQVYRLSLLGSWSLAATPLADVDRPESQEVLVSNEVCLQFGNGCLSGARMAPFSSGCPRLPSLAGDGLVRSRLALLSPLFCELAWQCLRLGLFTG